MNAVHTSVGSSIALDVASIRRDFPVLERTVRGLPLSYLDNAASSQRPGPSSTPCRGTTRRPTPTCTVACTR